MLLRASLIWACVSVCFTFGISAEWSYEGATITLANLNISYQDPNTGASHTGVREVGKYGSGAVGAASGLLVVGRHKVDTDQRNGCSLPWAASPPTEPWVALVSRGDCPDRDKVENALKLNASGILIYAKDAQAHLQKIARSSFSRRIYSSALQRLQRYPIDPATDQGNHQHVRMTGGERGVVVFLAHEQGEQLARMIENGTKVYISITRGQDVKYRITNINRTSVLFVSVSFIILMVISLAWLIFYYIQRFRYIHAKDRLARHLCNAAKKALSKIPVKNLKSGDKEVIADNECCAICIEPYQVSDTIRILPCKHQFHKYCVDPWLLEHRTCPMCKMDILKFYGYVLSDSEESVLQLDMVEDTSGADTEAQAPTPPPPPAHPRSSSISQVMVVPRVEATGTDLSCEGWAGSPVPDTPISPVHQPQSTAIPGSAACSVLRSVIDSAKTRVGHSAKISHSSLTPPSSAKSQESLVPSPLPEIDLCLETVEQFHADTCIQIQHSNDLEIASVCSEDFVDVQSVEDEMGLSFITSINVDSVGENSAISRSNMTLNEDSALNPLQSPSVPLSANTRLSSKAGSSHKEPTLLSKSAARSRSLSRKRSSGYKTRSASKRRSASHARSSSRGRSTARQDSSSRSGSTSASRSARAQSRPSSYVVNVSHV